MREDTYMYELSTWTTEAAVPWCTYRQQIDGILCQQPWRPPSDAARSSGTYVYTTYLVRMHLHQARNTHAAVMIICKHGILQTSLAESVSEDFSRKKEEDPQSTRGVLGKRINPGLLPIIHLHTQDGLYGFKSAFYCFEEGLQTSTC